MSDLRPHIRAARAYERAYSKTSADMHRRRAPPGFVQTFRDHANAHRIAAEILEAEEAAERRSSAPPVDPAPAHWHHPACAVQVGLPCNNDCPRDFEGWGKEK